MEDIEYLMYGLVFVIGFLLALLLTDYVDNKKDFTYYGNTVRIDNGAEVRVTILCSENSDHQIAFEEKKGTITKTSFPVLSELCEKQLGHFGGGGTKIIK